MLRLDQYGTVRYTVLERMLDRSRDPERLVEGDAGAGSKTPAQAETYSPRQREVLECALRLLVEGGERALTTARIAREANCSKQSLYKWFGDRDGVLAAVIGHQASKVRVGTPRLDRNDRTGLEADLVMFASDLLEVLAGDASLALNRLAIGQASRDGAVLGRLVLERGRRTIETRARALLEAGRRAGHLEAPDLGAAYRTLYGLIIGDWHVRLLLGDKPVGSEAERRAQAKRAVGHFFRLFGADEQKAGHRPG